MTNRTFTAPRIAVAALLAAASTSGLFAQAAPAPAPPVVDPPGTINVDWLETKGLSQPITKDQTGLEVEYTLEGKDVTTFVPIEADTFLWKNADTSQGSATTLLLRDGRYSEALLKLRTDVIPKQAQIVKASLRIKVLGVEAKGQAGTFSCYRILTPWTEDATWHKPKPGEATPWEGLRPGKDFAPAAFAQLAVASLNDKLPGGQIVLIPNFEDALKQWLAGTWENQGFLLALNGKAMQLGFASREELDNARTFVLGGPTDGKVLFVPNAPLFSQLFLKPDDLVAALPKLNVMKAKPTDKLPVDGQIKIYAVQGDDDDPSKRELLGSVAAKDLSTDGVEILPDIAAAVRKWNTPAGTGSNLLLTYEGGTVPIEIAGAGDHVRKPRLALQLHPSTPAHLFTLPSTPQPGVYTKLVDGHLSYNGKRLRLWGVVGYPNVDRLVDLGFNAQRVWEPSARVGVGSTYTEESAKKGEFAPYTKGDDSQMDKADKHFADLKSHGLFVMFGAVSGSIPLDPLYEDGSFVSGGADWDQWKAAVQAKEAGNPAQYIFVDDRLQKIKLQHARNVLTHVNLYTGKAYGEEENIAIYEVYNENGFLMKILSDGVGKWPPYFKTKLQKKWNDWLLAQYANDDGLKKAWGKLDAGESLGQGSVQPGPDFEDRTKYPEQRANDYVHFVVDLENQLHEKFRTYCRSLFPAGVGVNVVPFSFDTMYRPSLQWAYDESRGDVLSDGMYYWDLKSSLDKPPSSYLIDSFTVDKKPVVLYETNIGRPNSYRAEYPIKLAAMASYEDWDGVFWHYWGQVEGDKDTDVAYLNAALPPPVTTHYWMAVHHESDPVMCTAYALASRIFLGQYLPPADAPQIIKIGKQALFSYSAFRGINDARETFTTGSRLQFAPEDNSGVTENGNPPPLGARLEHAVASGKYITWDWPNARLIIDAPDVKAYVGKTDGSFRFSDGITLGNVSTPFVVFTMESADGKPLTGPQATSHILMGAVFDARNTGFAFNYKVVGGPMEQARAVSSPGHVPVLVDKVEYTVWFPHQFNGTLKSYDFALRQTNSTSISQDNRIVQQGPTPFLNELDVTSWGSEGTLPLAQATSINTDNPAPTAASASGDASTGLTAASLDYPIPGMDWKMSYGDAHKYIENSPLVFTTLKPLDMTTNPDKTVEVTDLKSVFWNSLVDAVLTFRDDHATGIDFTFKEPPPIQDIITKFSALIGEPTEKKLDEQYGTTRIFWKGKGGAPDITLTESQGIMKLIYQASGAAPSTAAASP